jgi:VWFA-related protein
MFVLALAAPLEFAQIHEPDAGTPIFRTGVSLVTIDAKVTARDGGDIPDLDASDFVIYDENEPRTPTHFARESAPIEVLLVIDISPSMRPHLNSLTPHAAEALGPLRAGDQAGLLVFAERNALIQPLTPEWKRLPGKIADTVFKDWLGRSTLVNEALVEAAKHLLSAPAKGRRSIVVLTDNKGAIGTIRDDQVVRQLHAADAVLNAILVGAETEPRVASRYSAPAATHPDVYRFAQATGGEVISGEQPDRALRRIVQQATTRYTLQYPTPEGSPGSFRKVRIELSPAARTRYPGAIVHARTGYEIPK